VKSKSEQINLHRLLTMPTNLLLHPKTTETITPITNLLPLQTMEPTMPTIVLRHQRTTKGLRDSLDAVYGIV
jgi:hypothetical protein